MDNIEQAEHDLKVYINSLLKEVRTVYTQNKVGGDLDSLISMLALVSEHAENTYLQAEHLKEISYTPKDKKETLESIEKELQYMQNKITCLKKTRELDGIKLKQWEREYFDLRTHYNTVLGDTNVVRLHEQNNKIR